MDVKDRLNPGQEGDTEIISKTLEQYLEKINCFVACLKSHDFVINADEESIDAIFKSAAEIEMTWSKDKGKLKNTLKKLYPSYNFSCCVDLVLEKFLDDPRTDEKIILYSVKKYIKINSKDKLFSLLIKLLQNKKIKEEAISLLLKSKNEDANRMLEAKAIVSLWEQVIVENFENFENCVINTFEKETSLFLYCLKLSEKSSGHLILTVLLKYLNYQPDLKMWFNLLSNRNIKMTSYLCSQYTEFLEGLLKFFSRYATEEECNDEKYRTQNSCLFNDFLNILRFLLTSDGSVGATIDEFINREICNFDSNYSFWIDIKALLN